MMKCKAKNNWLLFFLFFFSCSLSIWAQTTGISGRVTDASEAGIAGIDVYAYDLDYNFWDSARTDANGYYTVSALPAGQLKVFFDDSRDYNEYASEWYNAKRNFATAEPVSVTAGSITPNIDARLASNGISGRVTNTSGVGINDIYIHVYDLDYNFVGYKHTDASGNYSILGLPDGYVKVHFSDYSGYLLEYLPEWYNDKADFAAADQVMVTVDNITPDINAQLTGSGSISGRVIDAAGLAITNLYVQVYDLDNNLKASNWSNENGIYTLPGLLSGNYKVLFAHSDDYYALEWYNDKNNFAAADPIAVTAGSTTENINAQLATATFGQISGRVTNASGVGIADIYINVYDQNFFDVGSSSAPTDANGYYTVSNVPAGKVRVYFNVSQFQNYQYEWYNNKSSFATADPVTVTAGSITGGIDAELGINGISGRVIDMAGVGIQNICVKAHNLDYIYYSKTVLTDASGYYSLEGLPAGTFKVQFNNNGLNFISEWYNDKSSLAQADPVVVTAGHITPDINAQMAAGGSLSGRVTNASGVGIYYIRVIVKDLDNNTLGDRPTDVNGNYSVAGLPTGNYKVFFTENNQSSQDDRYIAEWYSGKSSFASADQVSVTVGSTTSNINAQLAAGICVFTPNGGENWSSVSIHTINWSSLRLLYIQNVNIDYSTNSGSSWNPVVANTANDGTYAWTVPAIAPSVNCLVRVSDAVDNDPSDSSNAVFTISALTETVSTPSQPTGANWGMIGVSYLFATNGSSSSLGHSLQYKFDWDDGSDSGWLAEGTTSASHAWTTNSTHNVRAMARCVTHIDIESPWSNTFAINILESNMSDKYNSPAQQKVLPEVIWAPAAGGGLWMSEVQVTDISGGSQVSVYYYTTTGRRGPFLLWDNSNGGALKSVKFSNMLQTIAGLDNGAFTYYGTLGAVEFFSQDAAHALQVTARTLNGSFSKTFPGLTIHDSNTADTSRAMIVANLTNNSIYRSTCGLFNPYADAVTVELRLRDAANNQIGSTITKTLSGYEFTAFSPFNDAGVAYPANSFDNVLLQIQPIAGTGKVLCFGASANNATNDPAAHIAVQNSAGHDNGPGSRQILPEAIWATASGGGTWMSETQIVDVSGGSTVSVSFNYGGGSIRGPFILWTGSVIGSKVKYANILQQIETIDSVFSYNGRVGAVEFQTQDSSHFIQVTARTLNGNYSKTFPALNYVDAETADTNRMMLIQNYANNSTYRSTCGFYNPTGDALTVEFRLLNGSGAQIGATFSRTFVGYDFQAFLPFNEAGVPYPANSFDNVILRVRPTSGTGRVICFGASANNASNDPAAHIAVQVQ